MISVYDNITYVLEYLNKMKIKYLDVKQTPAIQSVLLSY